MGSRPSKSHDMSGEGERREFEEIRINDILDADAQFEFEDALVREAVYQRLKRNSIATGCGRLKQKAQKQNYPNPKTHQSSPLKSDGILKLKPYKRERAYSKRKESGSELNQMRRMEKQSMNNLRRIIQQKKQVQMRVKLDQKAKACPYSS